MNSMIFFFKEGKLQNATGRDGKGNLRLVFPGMRR